MSAATLRFARTVVEKIAAHAKGCDEHKPSFIEQMDKVSPKPAVWWVKDEGVYLMSNGQSDEKSPVCYAKGFDPNRTRDAGALHDRCREACGGDDFCEVIEMDVIEEFLASSARNLELRVLRDRFEIGWRS